MQLDIIPIEETVKTFAEHLLAELEWLIHKVRPPSSIIRPTNPARIAQIKAVQVDDKKGEGGFSKRKGNVQVLCDGEWMPTWAGMQVGASG